jgi:SMC interacting uncharacterized protein involved in chromosome segregation
MPEGKDENEATTPVSLQQWGMHLVQEIKRQNKEIVGLRGDVRQLSEMAAALDERSKGVRDDVNDNKASIEEVRALTNKISTQLASLDTALRLKSGVWGVGGGFLATISVALLYGLYVLVQV